MVKNFASKAIVFYVDFWLLIEIFEVRGQLSQLIFCCSQTKNVFTILKDCYTHIDLRKPTKPKYLLFGPEKFCRPVFYSIIILSYCPFS